VHPIVLSSNTTRTQHSRPNHLISYHQSSQSYQYQQQHSRRSSVENKTTGVPLLRPNLNYSNTTHFVPHLTHEPALTPHLDLSLTQRQSVEDLQHHSNTPTNNNHPLHLNRHNFFKGFTFSRDDSIIN
jgi:hypothetical protein